MNNKYRKAESGHGGWIVVTTINEPTKAIEAISLLCAETGYSVVIVGDLKTPKDWMAPGITYLSPDAQREVFGDFAEMVPYQHYCRKNLGYLYAISRGATHILETDDDNIPYPNFGQGLGRFLNGDIIGGGGWVNVYSYFTRSQIWPRGLPLDAIQCHGTLMGEGTFDCPIQQYLADDDPDVDAIYRLINKAPVAFDVRSRPIILERGTWAPFNSQNTLFFSELFPLLYLPCHVSFRMTDIWRSFVAQSVLWQVGGRLAFLDATVKQVRNEHDLMKDFADEVVGYLNNRKIAKLIEDTIAKNSFECTTLVAVAKRVWIALVNGGIVPGIELPLLERWFSFFE